MKRKIFINIGLVVLVFFISFEIVYATSISLGKIFGGRIINTTATEIQTLQSSGWECIVPGTSITIRPIKSPATYIIPAGVISKTKTTPRSGQWILGKYSGKTTVTCTRACPPAICTTTATLNTITLFGTSK